MRIADLVNLEQIFSSCTAPMLDLESVTAAKMYRAMAIGSLLNTGK